VEEKEPGRQMKPHTQGIIKLRTIKRTCQASGSNPSSQAYVTYPRLHPNCEYSEIMVEETGNLKRLLE